MKTKILYTAIFGLLGLLLTGSWVLVSAANPPAPSSQPASEPLLIAQKVVGRVVATPGYLVWLDNRAPETAIYSYDLARQQSFAIPSPKGRKTGLTSDGRMLAWVVVNGQGEAGVQGYDFSTGQSFSILDSAPGQEFGGLALHNGTLYYKDATAAHVGIYSIELSSGQQTLLSATGQEPRVAGGLLVWTEETFRGEHIPSLWSLRMLRLGSNQAATELARSEGRFEYSLGAESVVWAALPPALDQKAYLYNLSLGTAVAISSQPVRGPQVSGQRVAWLSGSGQPGGGVTALLLDRSTGTLTAQVKASGATVELAGFAGSDKLAFTVAADAAKGEGSLYLASTGSRESNFKGAVGPSSLPLTLSPLDCGQVYKNGFQLYDCNGRWPVHGVQFILPQRGINGQTFWNDNYNSNPSELDYWLDRAAGYLGAKTLRIFVDMPGDTLPGPTSPATLYDFARRASERGMRLGVVLHNDTSWNLTAARQQWLGDFISYFKERNALPLLAYLSADNEINNHCASGSDCYDNNPAYVSKANQWVADFARHVKALNPAILLTVGVTTEMADLDGQPGVYNFFRTTGGAPALAESVDFLSPHNYGGGGYSIWPALRYNLAYQGPIVLEEYGYFTDVKSKNPFYTEGPAVCRDSPLDPLCTRTAPYFVEINARSMRENVVDGFAGGSAWMLADSQRKDCASPDDFFSGLFAVGPYPNCGQNGTTTTVTGSPKATAVRIRFHHTGNTAPALPPPPAPARLTATVISPQQLTLNWVASAGGASGYKVERRTNATTWAEIGTTGANVTTFQSTGLQEATQYSYRVRSFNAAFNSPYSNEAGGLTLPAPPSALAASTTATQATLTWTDNSGGETGYRLERKVASATAWTPLVTLPANTSGYQDSGLLNGTAYSYRVQAYNSSGNSIYSNVLTVTTAFPAPDGLNVAVASLIQLNVSWNDTSNNETGYRLERRPPTGQWAEVAQVAAGVTAYNDVGLQPGTSYLYRVRAVNGAGFSAYSPETGASTPLSATFTVSRADDDGSRAPNTLSYALANATAGQSILISSNIITVTGTLPSLGAGVTLVGRCGQNGAGPQTQIKGSSGLNGLVLGGNNSTVFGLKINGFSGPQLKALTSTTQVRCVSTGQ